MTSSAAIRMLWLSLSGSMLFGCTDSSFISSGSMGASDGKKTQGQDSDGDADGSDADDQDGDSDGADSDSDGADSDSDADSDGDSDSDADSGMDSDDDEVDIGDDYATEQDDVLAPLDSACAVGGVVSGKVPVAPASSGLKDIVPDSCRSGIEFNNLERSTFRLDAKSVSSKTIPLEIDVASYTAFDHMRLIAETEDGDVVVMNTCRLRTADYADPTDGNTRPPTDTIREFRLKLPAKTKALKFDWTDATTPTYIRVIGLCNFDKTAEVVTGKAPTLRPVSD